MVVTPSEERGARRLQKAMSLSVPVLADPGRQIYSALELRRTLAGTWQMSATAVIDAAGKVRYLHAHANPWRSCDLAELEVALRTMP